ncbi:5'-methylthioadenosine phosphorylase [Cryobacterium sp. TMS1-20-1]|uniref:MTAP family purine nucleoside phosphorylase n=1 Tax=Cryobacterium sp. TMS1-20-1 TaxID=1259223 RepID=UPI00106B7D1C|nr:MTAP family purine nucleoside phosphorylase [Cryobacterium sp. TMS1-20-1]TFC72383.1 5'-methylthioadenosine phosphorylase [Cryobacterium sp. TMS1-20-1]
MTIDPVLDPTARADVAVIGGSGLYELVDPATAVTHRIPTPYGSASVTIGLRAGRRVAFLPRHGSGHSVAPHLINYRANLWALASIGVRAIISSSAVGGVTPEYPPGLLVVTDQFIDRTSGRPDTFYDRESVQHLSAADPFDPQLRGYARRALEDLGENFAPSGTVVVIQGPRFSTRAESVWFRSMGAHIVNMTAYPEIVLAGELNMGTVNLSFVTDADAGLAPTPYAVEVGPVVDASGSSAPGLPVPGVAASGLAVSGSPASALSAPGASGGPVTPGATATSETDAVTASVVFRRLREAQPRILAAIDGILRALPTDFTPRELIDPAQVDAVLARAVLSDAAHGDSSSALPSDPAGDRT